MLRAKVLDESQSCLCRFGSKALGNSTQSLKVGIDLRAEKNLPVCVGNSQSFSVWFEHDLTE